MTSLRPPNQVMRLARLGAFHQTRLSFMRQLTRRMAREGWRFSRPVFALNHAGVGHAVYTAETASGRCYSLVAFSHDLPAEQRSDRVIAEAWDSTFSLFDGIPTSDDITRLGQNVPLQEAGRISAKELSLSRANRSVRLWSHVVEALASGRQPDSEHISAIGYLMRTTAVYGSGKFGAADRATIADRPELSAPFQVEMLAVYLIRSFVRDLVEHCARARGGTAAVGLEPGLARRLGIGNSTGLGMAPYLINHPRLLNNWVVARETAIARVRALPTATSAETALFRDLLRRSRILTAQWQSAHPLQQTRLQALRHDLQLTTDTLDTLLIDSRPWNRLLAWAERSLSEEGQEMLASLVLEPYSDLVDDLCPSMADHRSTPFVIDGAMTTDALKQAVQDRFGWALTLDWDAPENHARAWYVSAEKLEPRLGERFSEPIADYEQPLAPARDAVALFKALTALPEPRTVAEFLLDHPEHRHLVRRVQLLAACPYGEIHDNTIGAELMPIDMLRAKLSFFGATQFDPRSDRWVRICMYSGAPYPDELSPENADFWVYPEG